MTAVTAYRARIDGLGMAPGYRRRAGGAPELPAAQDPQDLVMEQSVAGDGAAAVGTRHAGEVAEAAARLLDDHLDRRHVPQRDLRLGGHVDSALGDHHVRPEVAEAAPAPAAPLQFEEALRQAVLRPRGDAGVAELRVLEVRHLRDPQRHAVGEGAGAEATPTTRPPSRSRAISVANTGMPRT